MVCLYDALNVDNVKVIAYLSCVSKLYLLLFEQNMRPMKRLIVIAAAISLSACTSTGSSQQDDQSSTSADVNKREILSKLAEGVQLLAESNRILYEVQNARAFEESTPEQRAQWRQEAYAMPESLRIPIRMDERGDAEKMLRMIARHVRYDVQGPYNKAPHDKPMAKIKSEGRSAYDIIKDISAQVRGRLQVDVMPNEDREAPVRGVIVLEYK